MTESPRVALQAAATVFVVKDVGKSVASVDPKNYPYGMRDFEITDLDGNQLSFGMDSST